MLFNSQTKLCILSFLFFVLCFTNLKAEKHVEQNLHENLKDSILSSAHRILLQQSQGQEGTNEETSTIFQLLKQFEKEALAQINRPEILKVTWSDTINAIEKNITHDQTELNKVSAVQIDLNSQLKNASLERDNQTNVLENLNTKLSSANANFAETQSVLQRYEKTVSKRINQAQVIEKHMESVFENVPDAAEVRELMKSPQTSFLELSAPYEGKASWIDGCRDLLERIILSESDDSYLVGLPSQTKLVYLEAILPTSSLPDVTMTTILTQALITTIHQLTDEVVEIQSTFIQEDDETDNFYSQNFEPRFTIKHSILISYEKVDILREKFSQSGLLYTKNILGLTNSNKSVQSTSVGIFKSALQEKVAFLAQPVVISPVYLMDDALAYLIGDEEFCAIVERFSAPNKNKTNLTPNTQFRLGLYIESSLYSFSELNSNISQIFQSIFDSIHLESTKIEVSSNILLENFDEISSTQTFYEKGKLFEFTGLTIEKCSEKCLNRVNCWGFDYSNSNCQIYQSTLKSGNTTNVSTPQGVRYIRKQNKSSLRIIENVQSNAHCQKICSESIFNQNCYAYYFEERSSNCFLADASSFGTRFEVVLTISSSFKSNNLCNPRTWTRFFSIANSDVNLSGEVVSVYKTVLFSDSIEKDFCSSDLSSLLSKPQSFLDSLPLTKPLDNNKIRLNKEINSKNSIIRNTLFFPIESTFLWSFYNIEKVINSISLLLSVPSNSIQIIDISEKTVILFCSISVPENDTVRVSMKFERILRNGELVKILKNSRLSVAWIASKSHDSLFIQYECSDELYTSHSGKFICNQESYTSSPVIRVSEPCECSKYATIVGHSYFSYDSRNGNCFTLEPNIGNKNREHWIQMQCFNSIEGDDIYFFSGRLIDSHVRSFVRLPEHKLIGIPEKNQKTVVSLNLDSCAFQCLQRTSCNSFDWNEQLLQCILNDYSAITTNSEFDSSLITTSNIFDHYERITNQNGLKQKSENDYFITKSSTEKNLKKLSAELASSLKNVETYLARDMAAKEIEHEKSVNNLSKSILSAQERIQNALESINSLNDLLSGVSLEAANLTNLIKENNQKLQQSKNDRDTEVAFASSRVPYYREQYDTIRELEEIIGNLMVLDSKKKQEKALSWLSKGNVGNTKELWKPFHDSPGSVFTANGDLKNKINVDDTQTTGYISCTSTEKKAIYSFMAEAHVTYNFNLFLNGYSLKSGVILIREVPSLHIIADHIDTNTQTEQNSQLTTSLASSTLQWECHKSAWYVLEVTSFIPNDCGSFGLSIVSSSPPFVLVVDGKEKKGVISCDSSHSTSTFTFDAVAGVSYKITTFTKQKDFSLSGSVVFLRKINAIKYLDENDSSFQYSLDRSQVVWTAPGNGQYEVKITSYDNVACGTFGVKIQTMSSCLTNPCPITMVCEDDVLEATFICRKPAFADFQSLSDGFLVYDFGVSMTIWLETPYSVNWRSEHSTQLLPVISFSSQISSAKNIQLSIIRPDSLGGVSVKFDVIGNSLEDSKLISDRLIQSFKDDSFRKGLVNKGLNVTSMWLLEMDLKADNSTASEQILDIQLLMKGLSWSSLQSNSIQIPIRVAIATAIHGVTPTNIAIVSTQKLPTTPTTPTTSSTQLLIESPNLFVESETLLVNISMKFISTNDQLLIIAHSLRSQDFTSLINLEFLNSGIQKSVTHVSVVSSSVDQILKMRNQLNICSSGDGCDGCEEYWNLVTNNWESKFINKCIYDTSIGQCIVQSNHSIQSNFDIQPCRQSVQEISESNKDPQVVFTIQLNGIGESNKFPEILIKAVIWWVHITNPTQVKILSNTPINPDSSLITFLFGAESNKEAVQMMSLLNYAVIGGEFTKFIRNSVQIANAFVVSCRLSNPSNTGVILPKNEIKLSGSVNCYRLDGGCQNDPRLNPFYPVDQRTNVPAPNGEVFTVPKPCGADYSDITVGFRTLSVGTVVLMDSNYVDLQRSVPNIVAALPFQSHPNSAITFAHTNDEWRNVLSTNKWLIFPKLVGTISNNIYSQEQKEMINQFVLNGGNIIIVGSPLRSSSLINSLFGTSIRDISPAQGGVSFLSGTNILSIDSIFYDSQLSKCNRQWKDQNSFTFVDPSSLPQNSRIFYREPNSNKVGVFDFRLGDKGGVVLYFGFDFFEIPVDDTVCVFRHLMAMETA